MRGRDATDHALRAGQVAGAAKRDDAPPGPVDAQPPAHSDIERVAIPSVRVGVVAPIGRNGIEQLLVVINDENDARIPADARLCLRMLEAQLRVVKEQILENDRRVRASARKTELGRRLMEIPGVGPLLASAFVATVADPHAFKSGRCLSAWIGLVPKQNSSGGKERLGSISKAGNRYLRQLLVVGAMAVIRYAERNGTRRPWLVQLMARRTTKVAAVALANKTARMVWALMTGGERYRESTIA
jgi:transposase